MTTHEDWHKAHPGYPCEYDVFVPAQPHDCDHPPDGSHPTGTRWDCDCGERWIALPPSPGERDPKTHWARWPHDKKPAPRRITRIRVPWRRS